MSFKQYVKEKNIKTSYNTNWCFVNEKKVETPKKKINSAPVIVKEEKKVIKKSQKVIVETPEKIDNIILRAAKICEGVKDLPRPVVTDNSTNQSSIKSKFGSIVGRASLL